MSVRQLRVFGIAAYVLVLAGSTSAAETDKPANGKDVFEVTLANPSFTQGVDNSGVPLGWSKYAGQGKDQRLAIVDGPDGGKALLIADGDPAAEIGVLQTFPSRAARPIRSRSRSEPWRVRPRRGAYLQFRFLPSNQLVQTGLAAPSDQRFSEVSVKATAPPDTTQARHLPLHAPRADAECARHRRRVCSAGCRPLRLLRRRRSRRNTPSSRTGISTSPWFKTASRPPRSWRRRRASTRPRPRRSSKRSRTAPA